MHLSWTPLHVLWQPKPKPKKQKFSRKKQPKEKKCVWATLVWSLNPWTSCGKSIFSKGIPPDLSPSYFHGKSPNLPENLNLPFNPILAFPGLGRAFDVPPSINFLKTIEGIDMELIPLIKRRQVNLVLLSSHSCDVIWRHYGAILDFHGAAPAILDFGTLSKLTFSHQLCWLYNFIR